MFRAVAALLFSLVVYVVSVMAKSSLAYKCTHNMFPLGLLVFIYAFPSAWPIAFLVTIYVAGRLMRKKCSAFSDTPKKSDGPDYTSGGSLSPFEAAYLIS